MDSNPGADEHCEFCGIIGGRTDVFANNGFLDAQFGVPYETESVVAFPDGAPLTIGHTLVVPRDHCLSFARLNARTQRDVLKTIYRIKSDLERRYPNVKPYFFEHGSCEEDEKTGCSTTHAHFHILFGPSQLFDNWSSREGFSSYSNLLGAWDEMGDSDYYLLGNFEGEVYGHEITEHSSLKCRMYLRKLFANMRDRPSLADYRRYMGDEATRDSLVENPRELMRTLRAINRDERVPIQAMQY